MSATKNIVAGSLAALIVAGGAFLGNMGGKGDTEPTDGGVTAPVIKPKTVEQVAPVAIASASGKKVFVVGEMRPENPVVTDTDLGKVVLKNEISESALCNIVFEAKLTRRTSPVPHGGTHEYEEPDFGVDFKSIKPVMIPGTCNAEKMCLFNTLLHGKECLKAVDVPGYIGSTMGEFLKLPLEMQQRFLKQNGTCTAKINGKDVQMGCLVPIGDAKANPDSPVFFGHSWSGRNDLSPMLAVKKDGKFVAVDRADVAMGTVEDSRAMKINP